MRALAILPYFGWTFGTLAGAVLGELLPAELVSSLGIAIYGMFIAIIIPPAKKSASVLGVVVTAASLSCIIHYTPLSNYISSGFSIILCAIVTSVIFAAMFPIKEKEDNTDE